MGYFSCNSDSSIIACDPYNSPNKIRKKKKNPKKPINNKIQRFSFTDLETATNSFSSSNFLGKGSHGSVYKASLHNGKLIVAVKKPSSSTVTISCDNEIEILSKIQNPNFVNLLGFSELKKTKLIVVEYMENGSLYDLLHINPNPIGWVKRVRFGLQVAKAVHALHSFDPPVIHRDIKSSNILIDGDWNARLGDFGLSLRGYDEDVRVRRTPPAGTLGYLDPGYVAPENLSAKSDVFSFGILLLEILSGRNAIDVNYSPPSVLDWALALIRHGEFLAICDPRIDPPEDLFVVEELAMLAGRCVRLNAEKRLSMGEVVECLRVVYKRVSSPIWNTLRRRKQTPLRGTNRFSSVHSIRPSLLHSRVSDRVCRRSNSVGSFSEIGRVKNGLDLGGNSIRRKPGVVVRMPATKLSKSRSLGVLESKDLVKDGERGFVVQLVKNSQVEVLDMSRLVISGDQGSQRGKLDLGQSIL